MKKLTIRLNISGKEKRFTAPKMVTGAVFQKTLKLEKDFDKRRDPEYLFNEYYPFLCAIFGHQFTEEQLKDGYDIREILPMASRAIDHVIEEMELNPKGEVLPFERPSAKRKEYKP
ncbi:phage tail assembly chaperone G [Planococcus beigongshangi]|uniref:phage tail assembly chaperone G n=1 Tax=Planococcus beigongshangi TaxID=2782536 RepID=UPI00193C860E|nr:hypothetical protein [Planococcus beigongshangi]